MYLTISLYKYNKVKLSKHITMYIMSIKLVIISKKLQFF